MAEPQTAGNVGKKRKALIILAVVVIIGFVAGASVNSYRKTHVSTDDAFIEGNIHTISARISGTVKTVLVTDNQFVKKGEILVELDPADYRSRAAAAAANLELQRANLRQTERELKRAKALFEQDAGSAERYDKALSAHEIAEAQVRLAAEQLHQAELNVAYTTITAPADGNVTRKSAQTGNQVQPGQPLMAVVDLNHLWVVANFKETEITRIRSGQQAIITVDSYPGKTFAGRVDSIMAGTGVSFSLFPAENATGNYVKVVQRIPVKIRLEEGADRDHVLRIGMSVVPTVMAK